MRDNALIYLRAHDSLAPSLRRFFVVRDVTVVSVSAPLIHPRVGGDR